MADETFYCDPCGDGRRWPRQMIPVLGRCDICGEEALGSARPTHTLVSIPMAGQLKFKI